MLLIALIERVNAYKIVIDGNFTRSLTYPNVWKRRIYVTYIDDKIHSVSIYKRMLYALWLVSWL